MSKFYYYTCNKCYKCLYLIEKTNSSYNCCIYRNIACLGFLTVIIQ